MSDDLPALPTGWTWANLGAIAEIKLGKMLSPKAYTPGLRQLPYLRNENVRWFSINTSDVKLMGFTDEEVEKYRLQIGDLLVCEGGEPGRCCVVTEATAHFMIQKALHRVRVHVAVSDSKFLQYFFSRFIASESLIERRSETTIKHLPREKMLRINVPLPPLAEQRRIVAKIEELFSDLDAGVAALERVRTKLKRYRASVLNAAVTGNLTEVWRQQNPPLQSAEELLAHVRTERKAAKRSDAKAKRDVDVSERTAFHEPLPIGWCWAAVNEVGRVQLGRQRSPAHHTGKHMRPYLRVANVFENRIDTSDVMEMNFTPDEFETYRLEPQDILLNEGQSLELIGRPAMYRDEVPGACFTNTLVRFKAGPAVLPEYALYVFLAYMKNGRFQKIATITVNLAHLGAGRFGELEFPVPPVEEQRAIVAEVDRRLSVVDAVEAEVKHGLKRAARLRQAILKRAFEGKLVPQDSTDEPARIATVSSGLPATLVASNQTFRRKSEMRHSGEATA